MGEQFLFSVIIPVYNVENYLHETIESVVDQTIGFEENIQLILVNDGSKDGSLDICREYEKKYPRNVTVVDKENGGVSSARNTGIEYIRGKYVNFLDSDDKWEPQSFEEVSRFFSEHEEELDVVACKIQFFDAVQYFHPLNYKFFEGTRVCDITREEEYYSFQSTAATTFIKASAIGDLRFDTQLKYGEDATFINKIILKRCVYGILDEAVYQYRRRSTGTSAVNNQVLDKDYYLVSLVRYHQELMQYCRDLWGRVLENLQSLIIYDMGYRLQRDEYREILNDEEIERFESLRKQILDEMDDELIINNRKHRDVYKKAQIMEIKYGGDFFREVEFAPEEHMLKYRGYRLANLYGKKGYCMLDFMRLEEGDLVIEGRVTRWLFGVTRKKARFGVEVDHKLYKMSLAEKVQPEDINTDSQINEEIRSEYYVRFEQRIPVSELETAIKKNKKCEISFYLYYDKERTDLRFLCGKFLPNNDEDAYGYRFYDEYGIRFHPRALVVRKPVSQLAERIWYEGHCYREWSKDEDRKELAKFRRQLLFDQLRKGTKKELWLISDRPDNAGDNGEVFFRYVQSLNLKNVHAVFVIGEGAACIPRLKEIGQVVYFDTDEYRRLFLLADKIISSGASEVTMNAFGKQRRYVKAFYNFKYYYLQHGVACADLSAWLKRSNKNLHMIFTSARKEYQGFLTGNYGYTEDQIKLTGQARFDALRNGRKKMILILPTWRRSIRQSYNEATESIYYDGFVQTEYFQFYNSLINDPRLLEVMRANGYTGLFCLHPIHKEQYVDYTENDVFSVNKGFVDYNQVFEDAALTVTDYSSVLFDFAYLRKPVVYAQFDKEEFFENQIYDEGYFSYEKDGFGPVCYDYESTVRTLVEYVEKDCELDPMYRERMDGFFAFSDQKNCERIYQEIIND